MVVPMPTVWAQIPVRNRGSKAQRTCRRHHHLTRRRRISRARGRTHTPRRRAIIPIFPIAPASALFARNRIRRQHRETKRRARQKPIRIRRRRIRRTTRTANTIPRQAFGVIVPIFPLAPAKASRLLEWERLAEVRQNHAHARIETTGRQHRQPGRCPPHFPSLRRRTTWASSANTTPRRAIIPIFPFAPARASRFLDRHATRTTARQPVNRSDRHKQHRACTFQRRGHTNTTLQIK